jgi:hypothetical protein
LSSAILYLAIVAIWACVLVPRWLRRSHVAPSDPEVLADQDQPEQAEYDRFDEFAAAGRGATADYAAPPEETAAAYPDPLAWENPAAAAAPGAPTVPESPVEASYSFTASYSAEVTYSASAETETADSGMPADYIDPGVPAAYGGPTAHGEPGPDHGETHDDGQIAKGNPAPGRRRPQVPMAPPGPAPHTLQARRRTLTILVAITVAALGAAFIGLTPWWTSVLPFVLLGVYLLLLREAAHADAEHAQSWVEARARAAEAAQAAELARERARQAYVAPPPQPTAEIISISELAAQAKDQLYDQYADAEVRAVGD